MKIKNNVDVGLAYFHRYDDDGILKMSQKMIDLRHLSFGGRNGWVAGEKVKLIDPGLECENLPLFVSVRGFYTDELFGTEEHILHVSLYEKVSVHERMFLKPSKYPYTDDLRDYLNWRFFEDMKRDMDELQNIKQKTADFKSQYGIDISDAGCMLFQNLNVSRTSRQEGSQFIPRHLHYDDFMDKWHGRINIRQMERQYSMPSTEWIIDCNFRAPKAQMYHSHHSMRGFNNLYFMTEPDLIKKLDDVGRYPEHPDNDLYVKLNREEIGKVGGLEMWDPVQDVVKVRKIIGNASFLSEFGYICTMSHYDVIYGELELQMRTILLT